MKAGASTAQRYAMKSQFDVMDQKGVTGRSKSPPNGAFESKRSSTGAINQFGAIKGKSGVGHKDYLKNMLVSRL